MNKKRMVIMLSASAVLFGGVFGMVQLRSYMIKDFFAHMPKPVVSVTAQPAELEEWQDVVPAVGTLQAVNGVDISASASGLVKEIAFQSGQAIKRGQLLLRLDSEVELSDIRSAQADADLARLSAERSRTLVKTNTVSQSALDKAEAELKVKEANVAKLKAQIDKKAVLAPFDGVLGIRKIDLGQYLTPGQAIVNLQDLSLMLAYFTVSQKDLAAVSPGEPVRLFTDAWPGRTFDGLIQAVEPQIDQKTGMVTVLAGFLNPDGALKPGMFARIEVLRPTAARVVTIPVSAVAYALHGDAVFLVADGPDGAKQAIRAVVTLGARRDGRVAVLKGLSAGDLVVTSGQLKLEQGSKVEVAAGDPLHQQAKSE